MLGDGLGLGDVVEVGVGEGLGLVLSVPVLVGDGDGDALSDGLDELSDGDGELESDALGLDEAVGDELELPEALAEPVAETVVLAEWESWALATVSSVAPAVCVLAAIVVFAAEAFFCE